MSLLKSFQLTKEQSLSLKPLIPSGGISRFNTDSDIKRDAVMPLCPLEEEYVETVSGILTRGLEPPDVLEAGLWVFGNVGLHDDQIYPKSHVGAVIPIVGSGRLYVTDGNKIEDCRIGKSNYGERLVTAVIFDDRKPHCYMGEGLTLAVICGVRRELLA